MLVASVQEDEGIDKVMSIEKYSSLEKMFRVTAWVNRCVQTLISKIRGNQATPTTGRLEREEIIRAEKPWIEVKGHWQRKFLSRNLEVLTHLRINIILISCQTLLFKSYSHINAPKF